jgi:hypothetical protein
LQKQPVPTLRNQRGEVTARDLLERASVEYSVQGPRATRVFLVEGMAGPEEARLAGAPYVTGIPQVGELHPAIPLLPVSSVRAELAPGCTTNALVTVEYSQATDGGGFINPPDETARAAIEIVSTVQTTTTNKDINNDQILVSHIHEDEEAGTSTLLTQGGTVEYQQPMLVAIFRRRENYSPGRSVPGGRGRSTDYVGKVSDNSTYLNATWFGDPPGMWLCTKMDGYSDDNGVTWNNTYEFQRRIPNWDATVVYRDPSTGEPVEFQAGQDDPQEVAVVQLYHSANFHTLRLFG